MKILIIEDETNIAQIIKLYLEQANFTTFIASDGVAGLEMHAREHPDLVILDLMLPALDGMEVCRRIRAWANTPILMLTARQSEDDRIAGLELGADDYLVKPFSPREVVSRVKAILRRVSAPTQASGGEEAGSNAFNTIENGAYTPAVLSSSSGAHLSAPASFKVESAARGKTDAEELRYGKLRIAIPARRVEVDGQSVTLTAKEFDLLVTLASAPDRVLDRKSVV